jgi:hypothetical protein
MVLMILKILQNDLVHHANIQVKIIKPSPLNFNICKTTWALQSQPHYKINICDTKIGPLNHASTLEIKVSSLTPCKLQFLF